MKRNAIALFCLLLAACSNPPEQKKEAAAKEAASVEEKKAPPPKPAGAPETFNVKFVTTKGPFTVEVHRDWAPKGVDRFFDLVKDGFYNDAGIFRVVPNFVAQFGLASTPAMTKKWDKSIDDDPVAHTNSVGTVTFATAGRNSRNTQIFINLRSNQSLDTQGFAPFGKVVEGMEVVEKFYSKYGDDPDQDAITTRGNSYLKQRFPQLDYIKTATILEK